MTTIWLLTKRLMQMDQVAAKAFHEIRKLGMRCCPVSSRLLIVPGDQVKDRKKSFSLYLTPSLFLGCVDETQFL
jgi:hypothetical protein